MWVAFELSEKTYSDIVLGCEEGEDSIITIDGELVEKMADKITISAIHSTFSSGAARAAARKASREAAARARSSGHGGHTSRRGGGGGFSGRHGGGGVR